jgi:hypothetical protein
MLKGLPSTDWPALAVAPGVWFRLVNQAFLGLHVAHQAGLVHGHLNASLVVLSPECVLKLCGFGEPPWLAGPSGAQAQEGDTSVDLITLGRIIGTWIASPSGGTGKKAKSRGLPSGLQAILDRLTAEDPAQRYATAGAVLEDLERAGGEVQANAAAWERFVRAAREQATESALRLSA